MNKNEENMGIELFLRIVAFAEEAKRLLLIK
jgi:hypothetical protein